MSTAASAEDPFASAQDTPFSSRYDQPAAVPEGLSERITPAAPPPDEHAHRRHVGVVSFHTFVKVRARTARRLRLYAIRALLALAQHTACLTRRFRRLRWL